MIAKVLAFVQITVLVITETESFAKYYAREVSFERCLFSVEKFCYSN